MSNVPSNLHYTKDHEWVKVEADGTVTVGITDYAQAALGDVTFIDLPKVGKQLESADVFGTVESVKAASDLYSPVSGEVIAINSSLNNTPDLVNREPYEKAWMIKIKLKSAAELDKLLDSSSYQSLL
ncbi:MAG: glycine cleavage system protein H [Opitutia bacterium]|nr:glycine cleavage system protein GcvH [Opitutales bacterium]PHX69302.1 MAG: glycine cleavage system protein H [Opitutae bacterium]